MGLSNPGLQTACQNLGWPFSRIERGEPVGYELASQIGLPMPSALLLVLRQSPDEIALPLPVQRLCNQGDFTGVATSLDILVMLSVSVLLIAVLARRFLLLIKLLNDLS